MNLYIDIETIPDQREGALLQARDRVKVPKNYTKPESIEKYRDDQANKAWRDTALDGAYGEIICVCWAVDYGDITSLSRDINDPEQDLLTRLNNALHDQCEDYTTQWVGHNVGFDMRFLFHRMAIHGIKPRISIPYGDAAWKNSYYDTMYVWSGAHSRISLKSLCEVLSIPVDVDDIDGSEVWDAVLDGRIQDVTVHCMRDVERVRQIYKRLTFAR